jgi:hypothetical protein
MRIVTVACSWGRKAVPTTVNGRSRTTRSLAGEFPDATVGTSDARVSAHTISSRNRTFLVCRGS